ncbi:MAG: LptF/LptG family permease [Mariprofundaceae bacterium]|nr:LptF/LptG family permease [Mariprofundaceae bacterium]
MMSKFKTIFIFTCLDWYVLRLWFWPFLGILCLVGSVFVIQNLLVWLSVLMEHDASLDLALTLFLSLMPSVLVMIIPIAFFFALLRTVSSLQESSELDAMYAGGRSLLQVFRPIFMAGMLLSLLMLWITMQLAPLGKVTTYNTVAQLSSLKSEPSFAPQRFIQGIADITFYVEGENADGSYAQVMFADGRGSHGQLVMYVAKKARFSNSDTGITLLLEDGDQISGEKDSLRAVHFEQYTIQIPLDLEESYRNLSPDSDPSFMDAQTLYTTLQAEQVSSKNIAQWHNRLVTPLIVLLLFCFALPMSLQAKRSQRGGTFFMAIALMALLNQSQLIVYNNIKLAILPWWSLWVLLLSFAALAYWLLWQVNRYGNLSHLWQGFKRRVT